MLLSLIISLNPFHHLIILVLEEFHCLEGVLVGNVNVNTLSQPRIFVAEANNASSSSTYKDSEAEIVLNPAPKPVLKSKEAKNQKGLFWNGELSEREDDEENEKNKVIESLGEVLEKAEKLETSNVNVNVNVNVNKAKASGDDGGSSGGKKTKTLKSVWRKGESVGTLQKVVKESPKVNNNDNRGGGEGKVESQGGSGAALLRPP
ncbi:hypothetical protein CRYUN_Cryun33cG0007800 [Craigia yunnanensis]